MTMSPSLALRRDVVPPPCPAASAPARTRSPEMRDRRVPLTTRIAARVHAFAYAFTAHGIAMSSAEGPVGHSERLGATTLLHRLRRDLAENRHVPVSLLVFDIAGTMEPDRFARILEAGLRDRDIRAQLSRDVFATVLWGADKDAARLVADGLWIMAGGMAATGRGPFRFGIAEAGPGSPEELLKRAVENLIAARPLTLDDER